MGQKFNNTNGGNFKMFEQHENKGKECINQSTTQSLAKLWAKKYIQNLDTKAVATGEKPWVSAYGKERSEIAEKLMYSLRYTSLQAWQKTEYLIGREIERHQINPRLIDPWQISEDAFEIYEKALESYAKMIAPQQLARIIGTYLGQIRDKYTSADPRTIGFVALQFHYTGQMMLSEVSSQWEQNQLLAYFKVIDDHLYMPLQRAYDAAASQDYDSPALSVVQTLLPCSTEIARNICQRTIELYPRYLSHSGSLHNPFVKTSSIRDVEMFQVYLWVCVLESNIAAIQQELFPLCVMLYPALKVHWELVRQMINLMGKEFANRVKPEQRQLFVPYFQALREMFSPEVFPESIEDEMRRTAQSMGATL
jgi:Phycobilisome protein